MKKVLLLTAVLAMMAIAGFSQTDNFWSTDNANRSSIIKDKSVARVSFPKEFKLFDLNDAAFKQAVYSIVDGRSSKHSTIISLPNTGGALEQFEIFEASNFEPTLQARFPEIRAYSGRGITDKSATLKLSVSPNGIQTMVFRVDRENEFIEPYSKDHTVYAVFKSQRASGELPWRCTTPDENLAISLNTQVSNAGIFARSGGNLKTMRLAQSCTGEYSNYFGATSSAQVGLVLAAYNNTLTRCNGVYEKDLALHLNLINETTNLIFYNGATDPYSASSVGTASSNSNNANGWNIQLQNTINTTLAGSLAASNALYDIGHLFGDNGGGGNAGCIGCVCVNPTANGQKQKGSGYTSPKDGIPLGDNFDIDYVAHEVGHQLGGNHTYSHVNEGTGVNKEVGSGITIMGYAGITNQDVAPHSIDIFHQASIAQIQANLNAKTCPITTTLANATPVIAAIGNFTIPISTPFALTGSATDANSSDVLTYCWEQNDNAGSTQTGTSSVASATKTSGPNFLSFSPTTSAIRVFPKLSTILAGALISGPLTGGDAGANTEALSSVSRTLNFRLTVRDNAPYSPTAPVSVGQTQFADMVVTVSNTSGPFAVTSPNTGVTWAGGSSQNITWSVNNTTAAPVSCANVKISLSTDGGLTFPTVLAASTANDGTEALVIPTTPSTTARIKVEAVGNIFFDISNTNFTIGGAVACGNATGLASSAIGNNTATISWNAVANATSYAVEYKLNSTATWTSFATAQTATTASLTGLTQGSLYDWRVQATCAAGTGSFVAAQFTTTSPASCNAPTGLASASITSSGATVSWSAVSGAANYDVDYKLTSATTWTNAVTASTTTSRSITGLAASSAYDWRVRANCTAVGLSSAYTQAQFTTTAVVVNTCPGTYDVSTNGTVAGAATIPFNTDIKGLINTTTDNDYYKFVVTTGGTATITLSTLPGDYDIRLYSSNGTTQLAISENGSTTSETITRTYTAGTYYVRVWGYQGANSTTTCYTLKVQLGTASRGTAEEFVQLSNDGVSVTPNPVSYTANLQFKVKDAGNANITITNQTGAVVLKKSTAVMNGENRKTLDVSTLANGMYFVRIQNGAEIQMAKIMIMK